MNEFFGSKEGTFHLLAYRKFWWTYSAKMRLSLKNNSFNFFSNIDLNNKNCYFSLILLKIKVIIAKKWKSKNFNGFFYQTYYLLDQPYKQICKKSKQPDLTQITLVLSDDNVTEL